MNIIVNFIKKGILVQVFSFKFCKIFKNTFFTGHPQATAWEYLQLSEFISVNVKEVLRTVYLFNNKVCINGIPCSTTRFG